MFIHIFYSLSLSSLLCFSSPFSLHNGLSLSHHISLSLWAILTWVVGPAWKWGWEVEIGVVWWRFLGFLGPNQHGMISSVFKLLPAWLAAWFPLNKCRQAELYHPWKCKIERQKWTPPGNARLGYSMVIFNLAENEGSDGSSRQKFRNFCLWVLLIDAFLVDLWSFGCLSWWVIAGFCLNDFWVLENIQWPFSWTSPEMNAPVEVADRNLGFFVCGFCWLMRFWLIYEVLGVWVDGYCRTISPPRRKWRIRWKLQREELKMRERREMGEKRKNFDIYYFIL